MKSKIVMDSAGDLKELGGVDYANVPLKILAGDHEFVDSDEATVDEMIDFLKTYKGAASTACPGVGEYMDAFGDADEVYCVTITSSLSGSYNAAAAAAREYQEAHPDRKIHVFDSLSAGPEMLLLTEKIRELVQQGIPHEKLVEKVKEYQKKTRLAFSLESLRNLANNGRVPTVVAKAVGILGIRLLGKASEEGTLQPCGKARGEKKVVPEMLKFLKEMGYAGGKLRIAHCRNEKAAGELKAALLQQFKNADISIGKTGALCSFYAEEGGMLVGFETA